MGFRNRPGFVTSQVSSKADGIFAKFVSPMYANTALKASESEGMDAELARRNLDDAPPPLSSEGRKGNGKGGGAIDTLAVLGIKGKGTDVNEVKDWFSQRPGYLQVQESSRIDGLFIKFASPQ